MHSGRLLIGVVLAVAVPAVGLHLSAPERHAHGLTASPFATPRLLVAHLVTAIPLGLMLAAGANQLGWANRDAGSPGARVFLAAAVTVAGVLITPAVGRSLADAGFIAHVVARSAVAVLLVTAWLFAGLGRVAAPGPLRGWHYAIGGMLAVMPAGVYAEQLREARTKELETYLGNGRFVRARGTLDELTDLGASPPSPAKDLAALKKQLDQEIRALGESVRRTLPDTAPVQARLARGFALIQLDRFSEAEVMLMPVAESDPGAALVLAAAYRDQERWDEAETMSARAVRLLGPDGDRDLLTTAYHGWAEAARNAGRPAAAERVLQEALTRLPERAAYFHLLLGRHYHDGGRPVPALDHLQEARRLDPDGHGKKAQEVIDSIRRATPACVLR
jgi:Tetratricopeptide repeat